MRQLILLFLFSLAATAEAGRYPLWTTIPDGTDMELGRATSVWVNYQGPAELDALVIAPWEEATAVSRGYSRRDGDVQRLRLRITPRQTGRLTLPSLRLGQAVLAPLTITVQPPRIAGTRVDPHWQVSPLTGWQQEQRVATLTVNLPADTALRPEVVAPRATGVAVTALAPTSTTLPDGGIRQTFRWLLLPRHDGEHLLAPPEVRLIRDGVPAWRFHLPRAVLSARRLPGYVTPIIPVGRLSGGLAGSPVIATGPTREQLQAALQQAGLDGDVDTRQGPDGSRSEIRIFGGWDATPAGLVYFDTQVGRLHNLRPTAPPPSPWWWLAAAAGVAVAAAWLGRGRLFMRWRWHRYWQQLRKMAQQHTEPDTLRAAICTLPMPHTGLAPHTLHRWIVDLGAPCAALAAAARDLEATCFGAARWDADRQHKLRSALSRPLE